MIPRPGHATRCLAAAAFLVVTLGLASPAEAGLIRGIQEVVAGILQVPIATLVGTFSGPPVLGTVLGTANGL
ncbi:MAG: hypothetical protein HY002_21540, partial [Candidatus Rokubacteria bacterium]|nr:hypothetical protein [Candidatus Rokubacteria bacterium]